MSPSLRSTPRPQSKPVLPQQPPLAERSVQININSVSDAKAVIQNLGKIKTFWELTNCKSVEFVIAEDVKDKVKPFLTGAIPWCKTFTKYVSPFDGNLLFELPHYVAPQPLEPKPTLEAPISIQPLVLESEPKTPGKSKRPVTAPTDAG